MVRTILKWKQNGSASKTVHGNKYFVQQNFNPILWVKCCSLFSGAAVIIVLYLILLVIVLKNFSEIENIESSTDVKYFSAYFTLYS